MVKPNPSIADVIKNLSRPPAQTESAGDVVSTPSNPSAEPSTPSQPSPTSQQLDEVQQLAEEVAEMEDELRSANRELREKKTELRDLMLDFDLQQIEVAGRTPTKLKSYRKKDLTKRSLTEVIGDKDQANAIWNKLPIKESFSVESGDPIEPE